MTIARLYNPRKFGYTMLEYTQVSRLEAVGAVRWGVTIVTYASGVLR